MTQDWPNMSTILLTVTVIAGVAYFWRERRMASSTGLMGDFHAYVPLNLGSTNTSEAARDFSRSFNSNAISLKLSDHPTTPITAVLDSAEDLPILLSQWFPSHSLLDLCLELFSVTGLLTVLQSSELPVSFKGNVLQPHYLLNVTPGESLSVCVYGFVGSPILGDKPDNKHTPWSLVVDSGNLLSSVPEVHLRVSSARGVNKSIDLK